MAGTMTSPVTLDGVDLRSSLTPTIHPLARHWYVDGTAGSDGGSGKSAKSPFKTMAKAFSLIRSGDVIHLWGKITEQLQTPAGVFDVTVMGPRAITRHPDQHQAHAEFDGQRSARWSTPSSPTSATPLCQVRQQGWEFWNILWDGLTASNVDCLEFYRDAGSGDSERDGSHGRVIGCRFQGGRYGVCQRGGVARIRILQNEFLLFSTSGNCAIRASGISGDAGVGTSWGWVIDGNDFLGCLTDIYGRGLSGPRITNNHHHLNGLGVTNTVAIDMTSGSEELVARNFMYCDSAEAGVINARFTASSTGIWGPNHYSDKEEYGEPSE